MSGRETRDLITSCADLIWTVPLKPKPEAPKAVAPKARSPFGVCQQGTTRPLFAFWRYLVCFTIVYALLMFLCVHVLAQV